MAETAFDRSFSKIPAQRFKMLDEETNVASFSFIEDTGSEILNKSYDDALKLEEDGQDLLDMAKENILDPAEEALDTISDLVRESATQVTSAVDYIKGGPDRLSKWLGETIGVSQSSSDGVAKLLARCKGRGSSPGYNGKPFDFSYQCQGQTAKVGNKGGDNCNAANFTNVMDKMSGGEYKSSFKNVQGAMNTIMSLSNFGYNLGLCGIFGAVADSKGISGALGEMELGKAAGGLLGSLSASSKVSGWIDVAKESATRDLAPLLSYPDAVKDMFSNFSIPDAFGERSLGTLGAMTTESVGGICPGWGDKNYMGSLEYIDASDFEYISDEGQEVFSCLATDNDWGIGQLDDIPDSNHDFLLSSGAEDEEVIVFT